MADVLNKFCADNDNLHRGRPRCSERNKSILKAATRLFMDKGFDGTSMDAVAKQAGVSKQTVYSHFCNKEALFSSAVMHKMEDYFPDNTQFFDRDFSMEEELCQAARKVVELLLSDDAMAVFRLLVAEAPKSTHLAEIFWEAGPKLMLKYLVALLKKWDKMGELKIDDFEDAAFLLISLLKGHLHFRLSIGLVSGFKEKELDAHADSVVKKFLKIYSS